MIALFRGDARRATGINANLGRSCRHGDTGRKCKRCAKKYSGMNEHDQLQGVAERKDTRSLGVNQL